VLKVNSLPVARRNEGESLRTLALNTSSQTVSWSASPVAQGDSIIAEDLKQSTEELRSAGLKALQQRDYRTASQLLKKATEGTQSDKAPWYELGRAYAALSAHDEAVAAFRKQIELNTSHKTAYDELASELEALGKHDEAVTAYKKQLETMPLDKVAHKQLGLLLARLKRDNDAITELEAFSSVPPADPQVEYTLGTLYARTGKADKAKPMLSKVVGFTGLPANADPFSQALRDDINADEALRDATDVLSDVGDQFDSGPYASDSHAALAAMPFVGLAWARAGWAHHLKHENLDAIRYLQAAFDLTTSPVVANRLGRVYESAGDKTKAQRLYALSSALGGPDSDDALARLKKLAPAAADDMVRKATAEVAALRAVKLAKVASDAKSASSLHLVFDGTAKPERIDYAPDLKGAEHAILNANYPVTFPEISSVKVVRQGALACQSSGCVVELKAVAFESEK
jgi:predicted Zn-dependent protease